MSLKSWRDRWFAWRDSRLMDPGFQRWAISTPWVRWIARRRARAVFDLVAGFVYSQILEACIRLRLFEYLSGGSRSLQSLARQLDLAEDKASRLLLAAVSLRLIERRGPDRFGLGPLGAPLVGNKAVAAMVLHHSALYSDLRDPVALLRGETAHTALGGYWPYAGADLPGRSEKLSADRIAAYSDLMSISQPLVLDEILHAYPLDQHRYLLDVGGGDGTFTAAVARRYPHLRCAVFDLPAVAERARCRLNGSEFGRRVAVFAGSFFDGPLPAGADIISLVRVLHDHDDAAVLTILKASRQALPVGGTLLLAEPMSEAPGAEPVGDAYFGFYLLAMGQGRARKASELSGLLLQAGFSEIRVCKTRMPLHTGLLVAKTGDRKVHDRS